MTLVYADTSQIVDGQVLDASDVAVPINALDTALANHLATSRSQRLFWASPSSGSGVPSYRAITADDLITALASPPAIGGTSQAKVTGSEIEARTQFRVVRPAGTSRAVQFYTDSSGTQIPRWIIEATSEAEGGGADGSNLRINRYDNVGAFLGEALRINRLTGIITHGPLSLFGDLSGGVAGQVALSAASATPAAGWGGAPNGYIKGYVGTQKVAIPYWNAS